MLMFCWVDVELGRLRSLALNNKKNKNKTLNYFTLLFHIMVVPFQFFTYIIMRACCLNGFICLLRKKYII